MKKAEIALLGGYAIACADYLRNASLLVAQCCTAANAVPRMWIRVAKHVKHGFLADGPLLVHPEIPVR
jgi:hypothetical protein